MDGTLRLTLAFSALLHLTTSAALPDSGRSNQTHGSPVMSNSGFTQDLSRANSPTNTISAVADSERRPARATPLPLDVVLVKQRLYEPPGMLDFAVVTPFDADNREAGVELRCNSQAVASTIWKLDDKSNTVREFRWKLTDENCVYELVAILVRTRDYLYLYQMVPSRVWLPDKMPTRQFGRGSRF